MAAVGVRNGAWQGILTPRQAEVLEGIAAGMTDAQIAAEQGYTYQTVKHHAANIYARLDVKSREDGPQGSAACSSRVLAARWWWEHVERAEG